MKELRYAARLWVDKEGDIGVDVPDLGGAGGMATHGGSWEEARSRARELVDGYLVCCLQDDEDPMDPQEKLPRGKGWEWVYPSIRVAIPWQIRRLRIARGMSQSDVARKMAIANETYWRWEQPTSGNPTIRTLEKVAGALGARVKVELEPVVQ